MARGAAGNSGLCFALVVCLSVAGCASNDSGKALDLDALDSDEGYVVSLLESTAMQTDPEAIWGLDLKIDIVPLGGATFRDIRSSDGPAGTSIHLDAGSSAQLIILRMRGGTHVIHRVRAGDHERELDTRFDVLPGRVTYIGDLELGVTTRIDGLGRTLLDSATLKVHSRTERIRSELRGVVEGELPTIADRIAREYRRP